MPGLEAARPGTIPGAYLRVGRTSGIETRGTVLGTYLPIP
jgi:hypothetical protein